ncbi:hypothetical protein DJ93_324 [Bacillus clarus]|nr:hypothetical protein DJ93_324 [Bacillus clarus]
MPLLDVQTTKPIFPTNESHNTLYNLQTLSEIISKDTLMKKLAQLVKTNYEKTHLANPVATYNLETWREMILVNDLIADGSFLFLNEQEEIIAYSFLHTSEKNNTLELGWCGTNTIQNLHLLQQLVIKQITYANKHGYSFLQGEFDSTSGYGIEILKSCPFQPCPTWITYQK